MLFAPIRPAFVQALHSHLHISSSTTPKPPTPDITLVHALLRHYHPHSLTSMRVLVGAHARAVRMLLHLAVRTLNECGDNDGAVVEASNAHTTLVVHRSPDTAARATYASTTVHATCTDYPTLVTSGEETYPPHHVLLLDLPHVFTQGVWSCAFALFPPHAHHVHAVCCELQHELGACVPPNVQRAAATAFTPPMLQYATNARTLVARLTEWVGARFAEAARARGGGGGGVSVRAPAPLDSWWCPYTCGVVLVAYSKAHAKRLVQRLQQRRNVQSGTVHSKAHEVHIVFADHRLVDGNALLAHLSSVRRDHPLLRALWKHVDAVLADTFE